MAIEYSDKLNDAIQKWEKKNGRSYIGSVEIAPDFKIRVFDEGFVKALLKRVDIFFREENKTEQMLRSIKQELLA